MKSDQCKFCEMISVILKNSTRTYFFQTGAECCCLNVCLRVFWYLFSLAIN